MSAQKRAPQLVAGALIAACEIVTRERLFSACAVGVHDVTQHVAQQANELAPRAVVAPIVFDARAAECAHTHDQHSLSLLNVSSARATCTAASQTSSVREISSASSSAMIASHSALRAVLTNSCRVLILISHRFLCMRLPNRYCRRRLFLRCVNRQRPRPRRAQDLRECDALSRRR